MTAEAEPYNWPTITDWLETLWPLFPDDEWLSIFSMRGDDRRTDWARSPEDAATVITELGAERNIWIGCATRAQPLLHGARGGAADCRHIPGLWLDIDILGPAHARTDLPPDRSTAFDVLGRFPLQPTAVVDSGNGLQAWWLFQEPVLVASAGPLLDDWAYTMAELFRQAGYGIDNVFDSARILRVPGTFNHKTTPPKPVSVAFSSGPRYGLDDIDQHLTSAPKPDPAELAPKVPYIGPRRPGDAFNAQISGADVLARAGWTHVRTDRSGDQHWRHPTSTNSTSATVYADDGHTTVWTTSFENVPAQRPFDPFGLYVHLFHEGNFRAATKAIVEAGFGSRALSAEDIATFYAANGWTAANEAPGAAGGNLDEPWPEPKPLYDRSVPPFPLDVFPSWIQVWCQDKAASVMTPVDLPAMLAIGTLSTIASQRISVYIKGTWVEPTNLYLVVGMDPSSGKSPIFKTAFSPIRTLQRELRERISREVIEADAKIKWLSKRLADAERQGSADPNSINDIISASVELQEAQAAKPVLPQLLAEDMTPEAFVDLLDKHRRIAIVSSEGGLFNSFDRYNDSKAAQLEPYLQAWSGDDITINRVRLDEPKIIEGALATICLTVQPRVLAEMGRRADFTKRGLPQRFCYALPESLVGKRNFRTAPPGEPKVQQIWEDRIGDLARRVYASTPIRLKLTPEALQMFEEWQNELEDRRAESGDLHELAQWTTKCESSVLRLCGLLWLADGKGFGDSVEVGEALMRRAMAVGRYWIDHAKVLAGTFWDEDSSDRTDAGAVLRLIRKRGWELFTVRDVMRANYRRFRSREIVEAAIEPLVESGYVKVTPHPTRPSMTAFSVNPASATRTGRVCTSEASATADSASSAPMTGEVSAQSRASLKMCSDIPSSSSVPLYLSLGDARQRAHFSTVQQEVSYADTSDTSPDSPPDDPFVQPGPFD